MLGIDVDFYQIFQISPTAMALFTADFEFIDANDEFLNAAHRELDELIGHNAFEVLPKVPSEPGIPKWTALEAALTSGRRETLALTRYDIEDPAHPGVFEERYWCSTVTPVRSNNGQVEILEFSAREVTPIIQQFLLMQTQPEPVQEKQRTPAVPQQVGRNGR
jgi:PAS domain-containing protein